MNYQILKKIFLVGFIFLLITFGAFQLFFTDFLVARFNQRTSKVFQTDVKLESIDLDLVQTSCTLHELRIKNPVERQGKDLYSFKSVLVQLDPWNSAMKLVKFKKIELDQLMLTVSLEEGDFRTVLDDSNRPSSQQVSHQSPELFFETIEVRGLSLNVVLPNSTKEIKVPDFRIEKLHVGHEVLPPAVHFVKSLLKEVLRESRKHIRGEIIEQLEKRFRQSAVEMIGDRFKQRIESIGVDSKALNDVGKRLENSVKRKFKKLFN